MVLQKLIYKYNYFFNFKDVALQIAQRFRHARLTGHDSDWQSAGNVLCDLRIVGNNFEN